MNHGIAQTLGRMLRSRPVIAVAAGLTVACGPGGSGAFDASFVATTPCPGLDGQTVRWIVPYTPGGGYDVQSRLLEPFYEEAIGAEIVVENRLGAAGRVGARMIRDAEPDGRTLGIVNASALLVQALLGHDTDIHPTEDFTAVGRLSVPSPVLFAAWDSPDRTLEELRGRSGDGPLVFGIVGVGSTAWIWYVVASELLGLDAAYVAGYAGTRESSLGLIRGEFDLAGYTFDSMLDRIEPGGLRPIAQISRYSAEDLPLLRDVPVVVGEDGLAARRARELGVDPMPQVARAAALDRMFQAGRMVVGPPGLDPRLTSCLRDRFALVMQDSSFIAVAAGARRKMAFAEASAVAAELEAAEPELEALRPVFRRYVEEARSGSSGR